MHTFPRPGSTDSPKNWAAFVRATAYLENMAARYPGKSNRLHFAVCFALLWIHACLFGRGVRFADKLVVRDHRSGVVFRDLLFDVDSGTIVARGPQFACQSMRALKLIFRSHEVVKNISPRGVFTTLSAVVFGEAVNTVRRSGRLDWMGTLVTADQSPATQILGLISNFYERPVALVHFNPGASSVSAAHNQPLYKVGSMFRFGDTEVVGQSNLPTTLIFERSVSVPREHTRRKDGLDIVVLLAYSTQARVVIRLVTALASLRVSRSISVRPHPRRTWPARLVGLLPKVIFDDSRNSGLQSVGKNCDVVLTTTLGSPPIVAQSMARDVFALAALDGRVDGACLRWQQVVATRSGTVLRRELVNEMPTHGELRTLMLWIADKASSHRLGPQTYRVIQEAYFVPRRSHLSALNAQRIPVVPHGVRNNNWVTVHK